MKTHTIKTYSIDEHPNPEAVYEWVRSNWHDLADYAFNDSIESLKGFASHYNANLDYSISAVPDRGEFITLKIDNEDISELSGVRLFKYINRHLSTYMDKYTGKEEKTLSGNCPFTGCSYDESLLDPVREFMKKPDDRTFQDLLNDCGNSLLDAIHNEAEYIYSDEGLKESLSSNDYDFNEDGSFF